MQKIGKFIKRHTWILLLLSCLVFVPQSFSYQAKLNMRVIVTGMGIDKVEDGYEITAQVVMPTPGSESGGGNATLGFISEIGVNVSDGVQKIAYKIGKTAGFSHMSFLIVGQNMLEDNLAESLDYFVRDPELNTSVMMLISPTTAKDMLSKTETLELSAGVGLQKVFIYKQSSFNGVMMPIEEFVNNAFGLSKSSAVGGILITEEGEEELGKSTSETLSSSENGLSSSGESGSSSGENSGSESGGQSGQGNNGSSSGGGGGSKSTGSSQDGRIKYYNDVYYFKRGKFIGKFEKEEELLGFFLTDNVSNNGEFTVKNVNGGVLKNATVGIQFREEKTRKKINFKEGKPVFELQIMFKDVRIVELLNDGALTEKIYRDPDEEMVSAIKKAIEKKVERDIMQTFEKAKTDDVDIFKIADKCYQFKPKQWKKFYEEHGEAYLDHVEVKVKTTIKNVN